MHRIIAIEFVTLDGRMQDPDGAEHTRNGGWAFRYGLEAIAGDKFRRSSCRQVRNMHVWHVQKGLIHA
jgi:hypothetical protein